MYPTVFLMMLGCDLNSEPAATPPAPAAPAPTEQPPTAPVSTAPDAAPAPGGSGGGGGSLPDVAANLARGQCSSGPGAEGADSYFTGTFTVSGNTVTGTERWILYANPKWEAKGGNDCYIEWRLSGTVAGTGACGACDQGVQFQATADKHSGNCPEELRLGRLLPDGRRVGGEANDFSQTYAIKRGADGSTKVYFAKSGKLLGEGYHSGDSFNYVSAHQCKWF
jgi:hypothetical protein